MTFRLSKDNRKYFSGISKQFRVDLDMYYLCLMMGIAANHKSDVTGTGGDLINYWPDKYNDYANFIIGILLFVEAKNVGIDISNKDTTTNHLNNFLDPNERSKLSLAKGFKEANRYANGGMEILVQKIPPPQLLGEFLVKYQSVLKEEIKKNNNFEF